MRKSFEHAHSTGAIKIYLLTTSRGEKRTFCQKNIKRNEKRKLEFFICFLLTATIRVWFLRFLVPQKKRMERRSW